MLSSNEMPLSLFELAVAIANQNSNIFLEYIQKVNKICFCANNIV